MSLIAEETQIIGETAHFPTVRHLVLRGSNQTIGTALAEIAKERHGVGPLSGGNQEISEARLRYFRSQYPIHLARKMIDWATQKAAKQEVSIEWVVADARTLDLQKQFSFIYLLGNAFQHFLTRADQEALFARVREHLHPQGCFLFGTRNPSPRNLFEARRQEPTTFTLPDGRQYVASEQQEYNPITQIQHYTFHDQWLTPEGLQEKNTAHTALHYVFPQEMEALLFYNGLEIRSCYGNWRQDPLTPTSGEMIYICQKRV